MAFRQPLGVLVLAVGVCVAAACGRSEPPPVAIATQEPIFKPVDPGQAPAPAPSLSASDAPVFLPAPPAGTPPAAGLQPPTGNSVPQPAAMVTDMASGWPVALGVGQEMEARLTQAAGARWSLRQGSDAGVVTALGPSAAATPPTQPAVEVFRLRAAKPGKTTITFDLSKGGAVIKSVSYPVTVQ